MPADPRARYEALIAALATRSPRAVRVVRKRDAPLHRAIDVALRVLTLGGQNRYLDGYVTTLGHTIYVPDGFADRDPDDAWITLRHELVHVAQFERLGWIAMTVLYLLLPLPMGLAYGRARLEWEAYRESLRATAEVRGLAAARSPALRAWIVARFVGPDYGWMWPFPATIDRWIDRALDELAAEARAAVEVG